ncbi:hypothetical protein TNCV_1090351 [Trichonephila clavipes]|uniref:Uncharacterized protein n=1 Tax=Trichonephila clavipes TaxID=2585209 RepID=A0A8X6SPK3_TRICX|nr:hypothetical protein TNCV_1090351 [Trichonephila clavipes]
MAPYRRKKPAPTDYTTDEEDMIRYDVEEDELEQPPDLVQKDGFNECLALCGRNRLLRRWTTQTLTDSSPPNFDCFYYLKTVF